MRHPYALPVAMALIALGGGCGPGEIRKDSNCTEENHCHLDESGSQTCDDGFVWEDPDDDNNFRCVPAVQQPVAPLLATFSVTPSSVVRGTSTDVVWNWTYVNTPTPTPACTVDHGVGLVTSGTATSVTINSATTYTLTCTNAAGSDTAVTTVGVAAAPVAPNIGTFIATPSSVTTGVPTNVTWSWTYANSPAPTPVCVVGNGVGSLTSGTVTSVTISSATTYTLTCTNVAGSDTAQATVSVVSAPVAPNIGTFTATPSSVTTGVPTNVTWTWTYANSPTPTPACTVDRGVGAVASGTATGGS